MDTIYLNKPELSSDIVTNLLESGKNDFSNNVIAKNSLNIDVILGGHTHTFLEKARIFENKNGIPVIVNQAGWAALSLGRIDLIFNNKKSQKFAEEFIKSQFFNNK